jgi:4-hydroxybutyryl-CoA dehydratase/vinylacetyl-CoA-Delta-isomerase
MTLLTAAPRMSGADPVYKRRVEAHVEDATVGDIRIAECITDAKGDRTRAPSKVPPSSI